VFGRRYSTGQVFLQINPSEIGMAFHPSTICRSYGAGPSTIILTYPRGIGFTFHRAGGAGGVKIEELKIVGLAEEKRNNRKRKGMKKSFFGYEFLEDLINVFPMTNVMDLDDMVLVVSFINNPKPFHPY